MLYKIKIRWTIHCEYTFTQTDYELEEKYIKKLIEKENAILFQ